MQWAGRKQEYPYPKTGRRRVRVVLRNIAMGTSLNSLGGIQTVEVVETVGAVENNG
jgi:hypothetical protein